MSVWETVLVVEDDDGVRLLVRDILEKAGYTVMEARRARKRSASAASMTVPSIFSSPT